MSDPSSGRGRSRAKKQRQEESQAQGYARIGGSSRQPAPHPPPALQRATRCRAPDGLGESRAHGEHAPRHATRKPADASRKPQSCRRRKRAHAQSGSRGQGERPGEVEGQSQAPSGSGPPAGLRDRGRSRQRPRAAARRPRPVELRGRAGRRAHQVRALDRRAPAQGRLRASAAQLTADHSEPFDRLRPQVTPLTTEVTHLRRAVCILPRHAELPRPRSRKTGDPIADRLWSVGANRPLLAVALSRFDRASPSAHPVGAR